MTRRAAISNKYPDAAGIQRFYTENIAGKQALKEDSLDKFLSGRKSAEQIDILQFFRYNLRDELNVNVAQRQIDRSIEKFENLRFLNKNYDLNDYQYEEKFALINERLRRALQQERRKRSGIAG